jgi:hypothetical protein
LEKKNQTFLKFKKKKMSYADMFEQSEALTAGAKRGRKPRKIKMYGTLREVWNGKAMYTNRNGLNLQRIHLVNELGKIKVRKGTLGLKDKENKKWHNGIKWVPYYGSRPQVFHGNAYRTKGGMKASDLMRNPQGKIVSKKASAAAKRARNLGSHEGQFGRATVLARARVLNPKFPKIVKRKSSPKPSPKKRTVKKAASVKYSPRKTRAQTKRASRRAGANDNFAESQMHPSHINGYNVDYSDYAHPYAQFAPQYM